MDGLMEDLLRRADRTRAGVPLRICASRRPSPRWPDRGGGRRGIGYWSSYNRGRAAGGGGRGAAGGGAVVGAVALITTGLPGTPPAYAMVTAALRAGNRARSA